jgi:transcriptional regulator with XRE-family HTH domain
MYKSIVAQNVKTILKERCLSQGAIANKAGYDGKVFSNMMNDRKIITDVDVANIARALGVTPNKLFGVGEAER